MYTYTQNIDALINRIKANHRRRKVKNIEGGGGGGGGERGQFLSRHMTCTDVAST